MKYFLTTAVLMMSVLAQAKNTPVVTCTSEDALDQVVFYVNGVEDGIDTISMNVSYPGEEVKVFTAEVAKDDLKNQLASGRVDLVLLTEESIVFGGAIDKAALLTAKNVDGVWDTRLAIAGVVHTISCKVL